jgi:hypothetical protein
MTSQLFISHRLFAAALSHEVRPSANQPRLKRVFGNQNAARSDEPAARSNSGHPRSRSDRREFNRFHAAYE